MSDVETLCPIKPHELTKKLRRDMTEIAEKVAAAAIVHNHGKGLLLLVYMAGMYHGVELSKGQAND